MTLGERLSAMLFRVRHDTDVALMDQRRALTCEHDADGECTPCYLERTADRW